MMKSLPLLTASAIGLLAGAVLLTSQAADAPAAAAASEKPTTGLQLYSLRSQFKLRGVAWTLDQVKSFGITEVELAGTYDQTPEQFKGELEKRGLKAVSSHFPFGRLKGDIAGVVKDAKALGSNTQGVPGSTTRMGSMKQNVAKPPPSSTKLAKRWRRKASPSSTTRTGMSSCLMVRARCSTCSLPRRSRSL
ncbi:hypothetical protein [Verrucomicrobium spinosum]|uniref:hypothetical protein n=1 Tax=Verrucomicrobium spinosum TaxID=2736 RepID=UPI000A9583BA|nr:hypothetical protein [Verrucomicrobium spinosum]